jgi:hypothetical protein
MNDADLSTIEAELDAAALRLGWRREFVFKHVGANRDVHREFYQALGRIPFKAHVHMLDKAAWHAQYGGKGSRGDDCICDGIATLLLRCPATFTDGQILYIDLPHKQRMTMKKYREVIRSALRGADRETFRRIKARPDNRRDGGIIQIADMLSGEVNENQGLGGRYLPSVSTNIVIV